MKKKTNIKGKYAVLKKQNKRIIFIITSSFTILLVFVVWRLAQTNIQLNSSQESTAPINNIVCQDMEGSMVHYHTHLEIIEFGHKITVPAGVGIVQASSNTCFYWLHTHDNSGMIHIESPVDRKYVLGDCFAIWKQTKGTTFNFSELQLPSNHIYVDGVLYRGSVNDIQLVSHRKIIINIGQESNEQNDPFVFPSGT